MKFKTFIQLFLLLLLMNTAIGCAPKIGETAASVEEAEKILAKKSKREGRINKKAKKKAQKAYWNMQSKEARKSIKRNLKNQKRTFKKKKKH